MSFEDDTVWRVHLDLYTYKAEPLPITQVTSRYIWTEEWSGKQIFPDGSYKNIGGRKRIRLDRNEMVRNGAVIRGRVGYYFENPDERLAPADPHDPEEKPIEVGSDAWKELARQDAERLQKMIEATCGHVWVKVHD